MVHSYSVKLLGNAGVGKTTMIQRLKTNRFEKRWLPTHCIHSHPLIFETSYGPMTLTLIDTPGQFQHNSAQYESYDGSILMFDFTSKISYDRISYWHSKCGNEPVWLIGNKTDCKDHHVTENTYTFPYQTTSMKKGTLRPVICEILRTLSGHSDLTLID